MKKIALFFKISFLLMTGISGHSSLMASEQNAGTIALNNLQAYEYMLPQQKVYLHTDKESYFSGERLWFKAYVTDLAQLKPDDTTTNLNVELINMDGKYLNLSLMPVENGLAYGDILLPDSMHEGSYFIRAYTDWMRNFDDGFYFEKEITVRNYREKNFISRREIRQSRNFNDELHEKEAIMQFGIFPEGGNLVAGLENRVAFKAANALGKGVAASGVLQDNSGTEILTFETIHDGMGRFSFIPEQEMAYKAIVRFEHGGEMEYALPSIADQGYILRTDHSERGLVIRAEATPGKSTEISIIAHTRGRVQFFLEAILDNYVFETTIPFSELPDGINHITLFDRNGPVAERLAFVYENGYRNVELSGHGDGLRLTFDLPAGVTGSYSLAAVSGGGQGETEHTEHIASYLLLTSDLEGMVYNPSYYLSSSGSEVQQAADLLMMTHGWRRFDWDQIIARDFPEIIHEPAEGLVVSGKVESLSRSHSFGNIPVMLTTTVTGRRIYNTETDRRGNFRFTGLDYENIFMGEISIETSASRRNYDIQLDIRQQDDIQYGMSFLTPTRMVLERGDNWSRTSRPDYYISAEKRAQPRGSRGYYGEPDQVVHIDELPTHYHSMHDLLRTNIRGLTIRDGMIYLRGPISMQGSSLPAFIVDGNMVDMGAFMGQRPEELDRIEVLSGSSAAILGVRGASGALISYSKTADTRRPGFEFAIQGYNTATEFYDSMIHTSQYQEYGVPKTLWWEPNIVPGSDGTVEISLPGNLRLENAVIVIEGIDEEGNLSLGRWGI